MGKICKFKQKFNRYRVSEQGSQIWLPKIFNEANKSISKALRKLKKKYKISNRFVLGHSDIAPLRKSDPGEKFPWVTLNRKRLGIWHSTSKRNNLYGKSKKKVIEKIFFKNLYKIGYRYFNKNKPSKKDKFIVKSFQRRFRQKKIDGKIDLECLEISNYLVKKY